jgi:hypothetical protein
MPKRRSTRSSDPFLDEVHELKKRAFAGAGYNVRTLIEQANKEGEARRAKRSPKKKSAA